MQLVNMIMSHYEIPA